MIQTKIYNIKEIIEFRYDININKDGLGEIDFTSNIEMYVLKTSINYDNTSIINTEVNKKNNITKIYGKFKIILLNKASQESKDVYINLLGNLNNRFIINKIYNLEYSNNPYIMGTYINIGKIPPKVNEIDGLKEVEIVIEYIGNIPGDNAILKLNAYEDKSNFVIENTPNITITATYASIMRGVNIFK